MRMSTEPRQFTAFSRLLHWTMAAMVLTMLCVGVAMVASLADYQVLVSVHRPLGIAILILVVVRFVNRLLNRPPPFPATMSRTERLAATASEFLMYGLMFILPLVGWGMLSAARYPIVLFGPLHLPYILPHNVMLYAVLRKAHTILAYLFFLTFLAHFGAILFHTLIVGDGTFSRMAPWNVRPQGPVKRVELVTGKAPSRVAAVGETATIQRGTPQVNGPNRQAGTPRPPREPPELGGPG
jgi:cytochrome b561